MKAEVLEAAPDTLCVQLNVDELAGGKAGNGLAERLAAAPQLAGTVLVLADKAPEPGQPGRWTWW